MNAAWFRPHGMPVQATLAQRAEWHLAHANACGCSDMPATVIAELCQGLRCSSCDPDRDRVLQIVQQIVQ